MRCTLIFSYRPSTGSGYLSGMALNRTLLGVMSPVWWDCFDLVSVDPYLSTELCRRVRVVTTTTSGPEPILEEIASQFEDLADVAETWACWCPASELSMSNTSDCCVGTSCFWTRSPSIPATDAWHCPGLQSPRRSNVSSYRSGARIPTTCHYACVWRCQDWYGESPSVHCAWEMATNGCCHARDSGQTTNVGKCWAPPGRGYHHWSEGTTHSTFWQRKTAITFLLAAVESSRSARLRPVSLEQGPDGIDSPTFLKQNFDVLEAVHLYQEAQLSPLEDLFDVNSPYPEGINQLALRISTYEYPLSALLAIYFLSATGICRLSSPWTIGSRRCSGTETRRLQRLSTLRMNGLMLKHCLHLWRTLWWRPSQSRAR